MPEDDAHQEQRLDLNFVNSKVVERQVPVLPHLFSVYLRSVYALP